MVVPSQRDHPMAEHGPTIGREVTSDGWGMVVFAGVMMVMLGIFHALEGLTAILKDEFFVFTPTNYLISVDLTGWGMLLWLVNRSDRSRRRRVLERCSASSSG